MEKKEFHKAANIYPLSNLFIITIVLPLKSFLLRLRQSVVAGKTSLWVSRKREKNKRRKKNNHFVLNDFIILIEAADA